MKTFKKVLGGVLLAALTLMTACGAGGSQQASADNESGAADSGKTYSFKMSHVTQTSHVWHKFSEKFGEELETRSNGRMKLDIFPASQLGPEKDMVQQLETGSLEFALLTGSYLSTRFPSLNGWFIPFMFPDLESTLKATESETAQRMLEPMAEQGLLPLGYMMAGNHNLLMKDSPVKSVDDLKGKTVRIAGGPILIDFWTMTGANPVSMGLQEVYTALQTGVIDGTVVDPNPTYSEKLYEVADYYNLTNHMAFPGIVVVSKVVYDQLPAEDQQIIQEAAAAAIEWGKEELLRTDKEYLELLRSELEIVELENPESFYPIRDELIEKYATDELLQQFVKENLQQ